MLDKTVAYGLDFLFPTTDRAVGHSLKVYGEFARPEIDLIADHMARCETAGTVIDVGANIGAICLPLAARHPTWTVVAVEAQRRLFGVLSANAINNRLFNVDCYNHAMGSEAGIARFPSVPLTATQNFGDVGLKVRQSFGTDPVVMTPLDDLVTDDVRFIKIDVQGSERDVLAGATRTLGEVRPSMILEVTRSEPAATEQMARIMFDHGYRLFVFFSPFATPNHGKPTGGRPSTNGDYSFLALPDGADNIWSLPEFRSMRDPWPGDISDFDYLIRYGFRPRVPRTGD